MGRTSKYESHVVPRFPEIKSWLETGATEFEVASALGIHPNIFQKYKKEHKELAELVKNSRCKPVQQIKEALFKKACGFHYTETTIVMNDHGTQTTTYNRYAQPDPTAALILLKHWDKDDNGNPKWTQDPAQLQIRKEELELAKVKAERENF